MMVKYHVAEIPGKGKGLIADELILKDKVFWELSKDNYVKFENREELISYLNAADEEWKKFTLSKTFAMGDIVILPLEDIKFVNHSYENNMIFQQIKASATKDIQPGEEIVANYLQLDIIDWFEDFLKEVGEILTHDVTNFI